MNINTTSSPRSSKSTNISSPSAHTPLPAHTPAFTQSHSFSTPTHTPSLTHSHTHPSPIAPDRITRLERLVQSLNDKISGLERIINHQQQQIATILSSHSTSLSSSSSTTTTPTVQPVMAVAVGPPILTEQPVPAQIPFVMPADEKKSPRKRRVKKEHTSPTGTPVKGVAVSPHITSMKAVAAISPRVLPVTSPRGLTSPRVIASITTGEVVHTPKHPETSMTSEKKDVVIEKSDVANEKTKDKQKDKEKKHKKKDKEKEKEKEKDASKKDSSNNSSSSSSSGSKKDSSSTKEKDVEKEGTEKKKRKKDKKKDKEQNKESSADKDKVQLQQQQETDKHKATEKESDKQKEKEKEKDKDKDVAKEKKKDKKRRAEDGADDKPKKERKKKENKNEEEKEKKRAKRARQEQEEPQSKDQFDALRAILPPTSMFAFLLQQQTEEMPTSSPPFLTSSSSPAVLSREPKKKKERVTSTKITPPLQAIASPAISTPLFARQDVTPVDIGTAATVLHTDPSSPTTSTSTYTSSASTSTSTSASTSTSTSTSPSIPTPISSSTSTADAMLDTPELTRSTSQEAAQAYKQLVNGTISPLIAPATATSTSTATSDAARRPIKSHDTSSDEEEDIPMQHENGDGEDTITPNPDMPETMPSQTQAQSQLQSQSQPQSQSQSQSRKRQKLKRKHRDIPSSSSPINTSNPELQEMEQDLITYQQSHPDTIIPKQSIIHDMTYQHPHHGLDQIINIRHVDDHIEYEIEHTEHGMKTRSWKTLPFLTESQLNETILRKLYLHQLEGVSFMWDNLMGNSPTGCILADCMGLGKTKQVLITLHLLFRHHIHHSISLPRILIIAPATVIRHWIKEIDDVNEWIGDEKGKIEPMVHYDSCQSFDQRIRLIDKWEKSRGLLFVSFDLFRELLSIHAFPDPDVVIVDEAHRLKNDKSVTHQMMKKIKTLKRILISGYPLQNNLSELYSMMDVARAGEHNFGDLRSFQIHYETPIHNWRTSTSTEDHARAYRRCALLYHELQQQRLLLRRDWTLLSTQLPPMHEIILTIRMSQQQHALYTSFLNLIEHHRMQEVEMIFGAFSIFDTISMLCTHPQVLRASLNETVDETDTIDTSPIHADEMIDDIHSQRKISSQQHTLLDWINIQLPSALEQDMSENHSGKMVILLTLLIASKSMGDRVVVFSRWRHTLTYIERMIARYNHTCINDTSHLSHFRFDGSTPQSTRQDQIDTFATKNIDVFLISTLCGEGINLCAANRVVIMDAGWNPSHDLQAAFRVYRYGQVKPVYVYRLITSHVLEQKVYQRQVQKQELSHWIFDRKSAVRSEADRLAWKTFFNPPPNVDEMIQRTCQINITTESKQDDVTMRILYEYGRGVRPVSHKQPEISTDKAWIMEAFEHATLMEQDVLAVTTADLTKARGEFDWDFRNEVIKHKDKRPRSSESISPEMSSLRATEISPAGSTSSSSQDITPQMIPVVENKPLVLVPLCLDDLIHEPGEESTTSTSTVTATTHSTSTPSTSTSTSASSTSSLPSLPGQRRRFTPTMKPALAHEKRREMKQAQPQPRPLSRHQFIPPVTMLGQRTKTWQRQQPPY